MWHTWGRERRAFLCVCNVTGKGFWVLGTYLEKHASFLFLASKHGREPGLHGGWPELKPASQ